MGVLIKGETDHYDMIKDAATSGLCLSLSRSRLALSLSFSLSVILSLCLILLLSLIPSLSPYMRARVCMVVDD
jgi:hypothetical protein